MKKIILIQSICFFLFTTLRAQIVTSTPGFPIETSEATIVFDASLGNKGLLGYTGNMYAHIGVITNLSTSDSDWKYVKASWTTNIADCKMTSLGSNKWSLKLSPTIRGYFGITNSSEIVKKLAFVFRSEDGTKTGKDSGDKDIFYTVYQPGLNISFSSPSTKVVLYSNSSTSTITANASQPATLKLFLNNTQIGSTVTNSATISTSYTFSAEGNYYLIAEAVNGSSIIRDSVYVCVKPASIPSATRPTGTKDGINYNSNTQVTLSLFAKGKSNIYVLGDFNDWKPNNSYLMKKDGDYFWITLNGLTPGKEYGFQYFVDGSIRCGDPYSEKILDPWNDKWINQNSIVYPDLIPYPSGKTEDVVSILQTGKAPFIWQNSSFTPPAKENTIIYELHFRDFTPEGTVKAALNKLDYLKSLGINMIEMMPIQEFDGNDSWGYNPNFWFAADKAYGTMNDYKQFIDACHSRGIAVVLDVVFNHSWGLSPMAKMWWDNTYNRPSSTNPYLFPIAMHPYNVGSDFNHSSAYTRNYFKEVLKYWLTEYKLDGFRFDLSKGLTPETFYTTDVTTWGNYNQGRIDILKDYNNTIKATNPNALTILEHFADNSEETVLANEGMFLWGNMNYSFSQSAMGFSTNSDFNGLIADSRGWTNNTRLIGYMESHDEERTAFKAKNNGFNTIATDSLVRFKQLATNAGLFLTAPGPKMIWQFGELGYDTSIEYNGRTGKKPTHWEYYLSPGRKAIYDTYSKILKMRSEFASTFANPTNFNWQVSSSDWANGRRAFISDGTNSVVVLANFNLSDVTAYPSFGKTGNWYELFSGETLNVTDINMPVTLPASGLKIYTTKKITSGVDNPIMDKVAIFPNPVKDVLYISGSEASTIEITSMNGSKVLQKQIYNQQVSVRELPAGIYVGKIVLANGQSSSLKICKL